MCESLIEKSRGAWAGIALEPPKTIQNTSAIARDKGSGEQPVKIVDK